MFATGDLLRSIIKDQLSSRIVYPNNISIKLNDVVEQNVMPEINGIIRVSIESINDLEELDGKSTHATAKLGLQTVQSPEVEIKDGTGSLSFEFDLIDFADGEKTIEIVVYAKSQDGIVTTLTASIDIESSRAERKLNDRILLSPSGSISASCSRFALSSNRKDFQIEPEKSSALLQVFIDSPRKLPANKKNVFVKLSIDNQIQETLPLTEDSNLWKNNFVFFLQDPNSDSLNIQVIDQITSDSFASFTYNVADLIARKNMQHELQAFPFSGSQNCEVLMSLKLHVLKRSQ